MMRTAWDYFTLLVIYLVLRTRWVYFHLHPHYQKFYASDKEAHFINKYTGELVSDIIMELTNGEKLRWWFQ